MLSYSLNSIPLVLAPETSVRIVFKNPVCKFDGIPGDVALGIEIPANEHNRTILGNPGRFSKFGSGSDRKFPGFEIRYSGVLLLSGTLVIKSASSASYSAWLQNMLGVMGEEQAEKKITEMNWPVGKIFDYNDGQPYTDAENDYNVVPVINPGWWDGIGKEVPNNTIYIDPLGIDETRPEKINAMRREHFKNYAWYVNQHGLPTIQPGLVVSPFLFLRYVITESLRLNRWFINRNDMTGGIYELNIWANLSIYNNFNIIDILPTTELKEDWSWDENLQREVQVGFHEITSFNWSLTEFAYRNLLPKISYADFLLGIQNYLNFVFRFRTDGRVDIIDRNAVLQLTAIDLDQWHRGTWEMGERTDVTLKFVGEYDKNDANFGSNYEDLTDRRADFADPVDTYDDLTALVAPVLGELRMVLTENRIYEYKWKVRSLEDVDFSERQRDEMGWEFVSSGPQPYLYGTAAEIEEIKTAIGPVYMQPYGLARIPNVNQKGNMAGIPSVYNDFSLRLITGNTYLWPDGWDGDNGLFKNRWERWARFWKNRLEVTAEFELPLNMINYLVENITNKFRTREGEFIIEEMECEFGMQQIGKTVIKGYKI